MYIIANVDGNTKLAEKMLRSNLYYLAWVTGCWLVGGPMFTLGCLIYPFFESLVLLSAVNWVWHGFMDPLNPLNDYILSPTFIDGPSNILNEDHHVVHHQYPGANWINHPYHVTKHAIEYQMNVATVFRHTHVFEVFGMILCRDYDTLANHFIDLRHLDTDEVGPYLLGKSCGTGNPDDEKLRASAALKIDRAMKDRKLHTERVRIVRDRLRVCLWGHRAVTRAC